MHLFADRSSDPWHQTVETYLVIDRACWEPRSGGPVLRCAPGDLYIVVTDRHGSSEALSYNGASEAARILSECLGTDLSQKLIEMYRDFQDRPFFARLDHAQYGAMYLHPLLGTPKIGISLKSRPDSMVMAAQHDLQAILDADGALRGDTNLPPLAPETGARLNTLMKAKAELEAVVGLSPTIQPAYPSEPEDEAEFGVCT